MTKKIPMARDLLEYTLKNCKIDKTARLLITGSLDLMYRERYKPVQASTTSNKMTPEIKKQILKEIAQDPTAQTKDIAAKYNVNQGRVSECLRDVYKH